MSDSGISTDSTDSELAIAQSLRRMALVGADEPVRLTALTGGVSSDIYRVDLPGGALCVKRALARLKVAADWRAPPSRNRHEVAWLRFVAGIAPQAVPKVLAEDETGLAFAMPFLPAEHYPVWKTRLRDGLIDPAFAAQLGRVLATIHGASADRADLAAAFATDADFHAIRLEPYLVATAERHPDLAPRLTALLNTTAGTRRVLVHGDVSPKNILCGPQGPVMLDAECAWFGDPAFDLAFCLNHLLLKAVWRPAHRAGYHSCFDALCRAYLGAVHWESSETLESRTAALLPGLMLARIDGKSPVEYIRCESNRALVRRFASARILEPGRTLAAIAQDWLATLDAQRPDPEQ
jgi:aminoglycoside phosphotransferase (APT) family kinase protein